MAELTPAQREKQELLELSVAPLAGEQRAAGELLSADGRRVPTPVCASLMREEMLQYRFMVLYQVLVAVLAVLTLVLLAWAAWSVSNSQTFQTAATGAGALATGAGAGFLIGQRQDARNAHKAAQASLGDHGCG